MRNARLLRRLADASGHFVDDHIVVRGVAAQEATEADDRVVFFCFGELARCKRNLEGPWNADDVDVFFFRTGLQQPIDRAQQQPLGNKSVKP